MLLWAPLALLVSGTVHAQAFPPGFVHPRPIVVPKPYDGPLRPNEAAPGWYARRTTDWDITPDVLERMQASIEGRAGRPLDGYRIQYRGVFAGGHRTIDVAGYCRSLFMTVKDLVENSMIVADGGSCFFHGRYDADEQRFTFLAFNGQG
jgi:hypothetical protein